jgi:hypothetical protein
MSTGLTDGKKCSVCGDILVAQTTIKKDPTNHNHIAGKTVDPTCTTYGYTPYTCACGDHYEGDMIAALGHNEGSPVEENRVEPTCTSEGSYDTVVYCTTCGDELSRTTSSIGKVNHDTTSIVFEPTCTERGYTQYSCKNCSYSKTGDIIDALGHSAGSPVEENRVEPTCTSEGSYDVVTYCTRCGDELSRTTKSIGMTAHNYIPGKTVQPTCTDAGYTPYTCACGASKSETIAALGHTSGSAAQENIVNATCTSGGSYDLVVRCTECNTVLSSTPKTIPATGHNYIAGKTIQPTCTKAGYTPYACACGATKSETIAALGHTEVTDPAVAATCTSDGLTEGKHCSVCGTVIVAQTKIPATAHNYNPMGICKNCGHNKNELA